MSKLCPGKKSCVICPGIFGFYLLTLGFIMTFLIRAAFLQTKIRPLLALNEKEEYFHRRGHKVFFLFTSNLCGLLAVTFIYGWKKIIFLIFLSGVLKFYGD